MSEVKYEDFLKLKEENLKLREDILNIKESLDVLKKQLEGNNSNEFKDNTIKKNESFDSKDSYKALIDFRIKKNKKEILKQKILEIVNESIDFSELKFLFVDFNKFSSKATFYSYVKELEFEKFIKVEKDRFGSKVFLMSKKLEA